MVVVVVVVAFEPAMRASEAVDAEERQRAWRPG